MPLPLEGTWRVTSGMGMPPALHGGELEARLDAALLAQGLRLLDASNSRDALATEDERTRRTTCAAQATVLPPSCTRLTAAFDESCILREYGSEVCETLLISFGGLVQGMGGITHHEFVGVCRRVGARPTTSFLFIKGVPSYGPAVARLAHRMPWQLCVSFRRSTASVVLACLHHPGDDRRRR